MPRLRLAFSFTVKSPVLASVTAARPICRPVRREVISTSGVARRMRSTCCEHAIGLGQRTARRHDVVENEAALIHLRQQIGAKRLIAEPRAQRPAPAQTAPSHSGLASAQSSARSMHAQHALQHAPRASCSSVLHRFSRSVAAAAMLRPGVQVSASSSEVSSAAVMVIASARKKLPVTPVTGDQRQKHHHRRNRRTDQRRRDLVQRLAHCLDARSRRRRDASRCSRPPRWHRRSPGRSPRPGRPASSG